MKRLIVSSVFLVSFLSACGSSESELKSSSRSRPQVAVVLGDSFSSGEAGRWRGNSFTGIDGGDRAATDKAAYSTVHGWRYDPARAYHRNSIKNGCHRSLTAPITYLKKHANIFPEGFDEVINLACSGAHSKHLWPKSAGGQTLKGESSQITRLGNIAAQHDIKLIVIGIGGNDMGFSDILKDCITAWAWKHWSWKIKPIASCISKLQNQYLPRLNKVFTSVSKTLKLVKAEMAKHGVSDYRIVLTGYPNIIPGFYGFAYKEGSRRIRNCPIIGGDAQWIGEHLVPGLNATLAAVAEKEKVDFINLTNAFDGHRVCEAGTRRVVKFRSPNDQDTEWVRYLDAEGTSPQNFTAIIGKLAGVLDGNELAYVAGDQGSLSESFHPNEYGQKAIGHCLKSYLRKKTAKPGSYKCFNGESGKASDMQVQAY